jgi:hypothetical protein
MKKSWKNRLFPDQPSFGARSWINCLRITDNYWPIADSLFQIALYIYYNNPYNNS